jgi:hypothetical protein
VKLVKLRFRAMPTDPPRTFVEKAQRVFDVAVALFRQNPNASTGHALVLARSARRTSPSASASPRHDLRVAAAAAITETVAKVNHVIDVTPQETHQ